MIRSIIVYYFTVGDSIKTPDVFAGWNTAPQVPNPVLDRANPESQGVLIDHAILHDDADCFNAITFWSIEPFFIGTNNA